MIHNKKIKILKIKKNNNKLNNNLRRNIKNNNLSIFKKMVLVEN